VSEDGGVGFRVDDTMTVGPEMRSSAMSKLVGAATDPRTGVAESWHKQHDGGWRRWVFPSVWLIYLVQTVSGVHKHSSGALAVLGYLIVAVFSVGYVVALPLGWRDARRPVILAVAALCGLTAVECVLAHEDALTMTVYIAVIAMGGIGRFAPLFVAALTAVAVATPALVPSWHTTPAWDLGVILPMVALAMYGFFSIIRSNYALNEARAEVARLAAENERSRIARDLHDLLGHSLTTITVKAGLAYRLTERDPARAAQEIGEVEALTRSTLADVRAAVAGYREVTLAGELASAREVLRASGVDALVPRAIDSVRGEYTELFGWVLREGVTNVVRHSRADTCTISVGETWLEITDDGRGGMNDPGNGLIGLRERVSAQGGTVSASSPDDGGWQLRVDMPPFVVAATSVHAFTR
jgi:two-component system sensor histidine kinase DesK